MIHRFEVNPPATAVLIHSGSNREHAMPLEDPDEYVQARMIGGRDQYGEYQKPCLITIDDGTERGQLELVWLTERMQSGKLPGVKPFAPQLGVSDDQIDAMVERRVQEELQRRGYVERPSEEARVLLQGDDETERGKIFANHSPQWIGTDTQTPAPSLAPAAIELVQVEPLKIEVTRAGLYRCPLDRRAFHGKAGFRRHFRLSNDAEHMKIAEQAIEAI